MAGLYIHIPFCKSRCIYCGFYSSTLHAWQDHYVDAICHEMDLRNSPASNDKSPNTTLSTIYLGGGTPSQLSEENLRKLFLYINKVYDTQDVKEVTLECNPDDVTDEFCKLLHDLPVNRVSMGAQTFCDERLRFLRRRHTAKQVTEAVGRLKDNGIDNISLDLMFGFPEETLNEWEKDIEQALSLNVEHISAYSLMYEEGTELFQQLQDKKIQKIDDDLSRDMYELLIDKLENAGFEHYEISNFARTKRSLHNSSYWNQTPYIGLGAAAHSYDGKTRSWNVSDLKKYVESIEAGLRPFEYEEIDEETRYNDIITTALRTREGISLTALPQHYRNYLIQNAQRALASGLLYVDNNHIRLTRQGLFVSDDVMSDLIYV
ncbi:MAG: radical SAM family heme chaperone HemW [Prevotella sp.]|nr:radical SAM family heme chaperone HemW [Prevotella sp.]